MRWQYRISFAEGNSGVRPTEDRIEDPLFSFREKFGTDRVLRVEERYGTGKFTRSELLPTCPEEADSVNAIVEEEAVYPPLSDGEKTKIEDWFDGTE